MTELIDLNAYRMKHKGEVMFLGCPCEAEDGYEIVSCRGRSLPVVVAIVCRSCGAQNDVLHGEVLP